MRRRPITIACLLALGLTLSGCESFDPTDWFNSKKPLPGDRKAVFPSGVPGVAPGVPPELVEGYRPPPPPPPPQVAEVPVEKPKPKPKPKSKPRPKKIVAAPAHPATAVTVQPMRPAQRSSSRPAPGQPAAQSAPWPAPQQTASQPAQPQAQSPFPDPPPPGTFSR